MKRLLSILCMALLGIALHAEQKLWYKQAATQWLEALPVGNSHMGAMVYGGADTEQLQLNEETFWSGGPYNNNSTEAYQHLNEVRQLIFDGQERKAHDLIERHFMRQPYGMRYLTLGSLYLKFWNEQNPREYYRDLNLENATASVSYRVGDATIRRTVFASLADNIIVVRLESDRPGLLSFALSHDCQLPTTVKAEGHELTAVISNVEQENVAGVLKAECRVSVESDGQTEARENRIVVKGATTATLYIAAATNFVNYHDTSANPTKRNDDALAAARQYSYDELLERHVAKYRSQYGRVSLTLPKSEKSGRPTDERLADFAKDEKDMDLVALMFQYGRYLLISSSQPGGQPANLQGIWNDKMNAPWDSKYTININTEMNYWPALVGNLAETQQPLFDMLQDLKTTGAVTAKTMYGCGGWVAHHNTDLWRVTGPVDGTTWGMFPTGGAWLTTHIWQHYLFTGDKDFLRHHYTVLKGAAQFLLDYCQTYPAMGEVKQAEGWLMTVPTVSPEHGPKGKGTTVTAGSTMDNQIVFDVFSQMLAAMKVLNIKVPMLENDLRKAIEKLPPMQIGRYGQLQEWLIDADDPKDEHRHISHLYGLYPSNQISPYSHPELFTAAANTLKQRGDMATGWSLGWKINFWARMLDGNHAFLILKNMLHLLPNDHVAKFYPEGRTYPNLFDAHPPFQIDGNFGCAAGVAEMLVQSHDGAIHLLPALPDAWHQGQVSGLRTRGGYEVSIDWAKGRLTCASITATIDGKLRIRSYVPLEGKGLKKAQGKCPNELMAPAAIREPLKSAELKDFKLLPLQQVYEYDLSLDAGETVELTAK